VLRARSYLVAEAALQLLWDAVVVPELRPYQDGDLPAMYRVCLLTGDAGRDATPLFRDPELLGHLYCGPYPTADPSLSLVVADGDGVAGYLVGTADSIGFARWEEERWWPALRARYPLGPEDGTADRRLVDRIHHRPSPESPPGFPAHLHIDLLPRLQGQGWGRRLIEAFAGLLGERGVPGMHLDVDPRNTGALAFYERLGFVPDGTGLLLLPVSPRP
jgi:ribosomal protein S18 acetylase RimI-like enzyme